MAKTIQEAIDYLVTQTLAMNAEISTWRFPTKDIDEMLGDPKTSALQRSMLLILKQKVDQNKNIKYDA